MGRAPCCDKANVKKGPWSPEEDAKLKAYIEEHGTGGNWIALPQKIGLKRCGKSCRLRWLNYLRPNIKHGGFSEEEDNIICSLYISIGSRWSIIAAQLPGRTDNDIKNYWNTRLKKKLLGKQRKENAKKAACALKQEIKRESINNGSFVFTENSTSIDQAATSYWPPQQPLPSSIIPSQVSDFRTMNDHVSLRRLLVKLGGRFSDNDNDFGTTTQPLVNATANGVLKSYEPVDHNSSTTILYGTSSTDNCKFITSTSPESLDSLNAHDHGCSKYWQGEQIPSSNYMQVQASHSDHISNELEKIIYSNNVDQTTQRVVNDLDCFFGTGGLMGSENQSCGTTCGSESISWYDLSSLVHPPLISSINYEGRMAQECLSTQTRFPDLH